MTANLPPRTGRIVMILENESFPDDTRVYHEATALVDAGHSVTVICPTGKRRGAFETVDGVHVYRYPRPWELSGFLGYVYEYLYSMFAAWSLSCYVGVRHGFDVVHIHCPPDMNILIGLFFRCLGKKIVVDLHDLSPELYTARQGGGGSPLVLGALRWFERLATRAADRLIATNTAQRQVQIDRGGADPRRCYVVRNGPDNCFIPSAPRPATIRFVNRIIVGYVGIIGIQDGVDNLVRALAEVRSARPQVAGVIVGAGPALSALRSLTAELGLTDVVQFTGFVDFRSVPGYIAAFDICVTPDPSNSYNDTCTTIKTMEYMALGKPTVAFDTRENRITAGPAALYAGSNSISELARLIIRLADDPALRCRMGTFARERVDRYLRWERQRVELLALYSDLFAGRLQTDEHLQMVLDGQRALAESSLPERTGFEDPQAPDRQGTSLEGKGDLPADSTHPAPTQPTA
ncbi:MAG: glycosyltransferase family 4 protein [Pirellulaceae bacterium]